MSFDIQNIETKNTVSGTYESYALNYYRAQGADGIVTGISYWWFVITLLFWDVIFAHITTSKGVIDDEMLNINGMPNDMFYKEFYYNRKYLIKKRIKDLLHSSIVGEIQRSYQNNYGVTARLIENWDSYSLDELTYPFLYLNNVEALGICLRFLYDICENRRGLPDIFIVNKDGYFLAEVKSRNDIISKSQQLWHIYLDRILGMSIKIICINKTSTSMRKIEKKYTVASLQNDIEQDLLLEYQEIFSQPDSIFRIVFSKLFR